LAQKKKGEIGSSFDGFLAEEGILEPCEGQALKLILADQIKKRQPYKIRDGGKDADEQARARSPAGPQEYGRHSAYPASRRRRSLEDNSVWNWYERVTLNDSASNIEGQSRIIESRGKVLTALDRPPCTSCAGQFRIPTIRSRCTTRKYRPWP
jgi:hypothetical protein